MIVKFKRVINNRLALKILIYILFFGSALSLAATFVQLYFDSQQNLKDVKQSIAIIEETRLEPITLSLYNYDVSQLGIQLESLLNLTGIVYLRVTEQEGFELAVGDSPQGSEQIINETIDLIYIDASKKGTLLGKLEITAKLTDPYHRIYARLPLLLITNLFKIFITIIAVFGIVHLLITRHLSSIADYASNVNMEKLDTPLSLKRKPFLFIKEDEIDQLTDALNSMRLRLKKGIEEQSEFEKRLVRSEERLRQLVNATRDAVVVHENGIIIFANAQFYTMLGYTPAELENVNIITRLMVPESSELSKSIVAKKKLGHYEVVGLRKGKTTFPAEIHTKAMEFHGKEVRVASIRDITDYKKVQDEIAKLRNFLKSIIDSMPSLIAGIDTQGNVSEWNREAENVTGVSVENAMGKPIAELFSRIDVDIEMIRNAVLSKNIEKLPKVKVHKDGEEYFFDITIYPLGQGFDGVAIRADNITDTLRIEEMLIQSEKMLSVGGLAAGMAHEINNPLAGVLQNLQVIENRLKKDLPQNLNTATECGIEMSSMQEYMEKREIFNLMDSISESGKRAATIVRDMLSFARKSDSVFTEDDLLKTMESAIELAEKEYNLKKKFDFKKIKIIREYDKIPLILCNHNKIKQVLLNILKNGAQAMAEIDIDEVEPCFILRIFKKNNMVRIEIQDNGPGIDNEIQKKIFEPFYTTKPVGIGTGLGLSVAYFIICENHQGRMGVHSFPGQGATFYIELPIT
jgi:PAS domain S-box-containing protein